MREREAFQEMDYRAFFGVVAKWVTEIDDPARIPEIDRRAFHVAAAGRPGPVVIALPEDMLTEMAAVADALPFEPVEVHPAPRKWRSSATLLERGRAPRRDSRRQRLDRAAAAAASRLRRAFALPVVCSFRRQTLMSSRASLLRRRSRHRPNPKLARADQGGRSPAPRRRPRLGEIPSQGYTLLDIPVPRQRWSTSTRTPRSSAGSIVRSLRSMPRPLHLRRAGGPEPADEPRWRARAQAAHAAYLAWSDAEPQPGAVQLGSCSAFSASGFRPIRSSSTAPATTPPGSTASGRTAASARSLRRPPARWATACRRPSPPSGCIRSARSSPSPATAAS